MRARAILAVDDSFFAEGSGNRRTPTIFPVVQTARIFAEEGMAEKPGHILRVQDAYRGYLAFCEAKGLPWLKRLEFRDPMVEAIKRKAGVSMRKDLKVDGKWINGWKHIDVISSSSDSGGLSLPG